MPKLVTQIRHEIADIAKRGISVLLVEQNLRTALRLANRVYLMERGQSFTKGPPTAFRPVPISFTDTLASLSNPRKEYDNDEAS